MQCASPGTFYTVPHTEPARHLSHPRYSPPEEQPVFYLGLVRGDVTHGNVMPRWDSECHVHLLAMGSPVVGSSMLPGQRQHQALGSPALLPGLTMTCHTPQTPSQVPGLPRTWSEACGLRGQLAKSRALLEPSLSPSFPIYEMGTIIGSISQGVSGINTCKGHSPVLGS